MRKYAKWCRRFGRRNPSRRATGPYYPRCTVSHTVLSRHRRLLDSLERECEKIIDLRADNMDRSEFYTVVATLQVPTRGAMIRRELSSATTDKGCFGR